MCRIGRTRCWILMFGVLFPVWGALQGQEPVVDPVATAKQEIEAVLIRYQQAAVNADAEAFFGCLHPDGIFFGTDEIERFTFDQLKSTVGPYFERGIGWKRVVKKRHIYVGPNAVVGWFEEVSVRESIPMRATGVVRKTDDGWKIIQQNTSFTIPNEIYPKLSELILETKKSAADPRASGDSVTPMTSAERALYDEAFEYVWKKVKDTYWDQNLGGVDWQSAYDAFKPKLESAQSAAEAQAILNDLLQQMKVSHFGIIPRSAYDSLGELDQRGSLAGTTGIDVRIVGDQVMVVAIEPESAAAEAGIEAGWTILAIDEIDVPAKLMELRKQFQGNAHARTILASAANARLRGAVGDRITIKFHDGDGKDVIRELSLREGRGQKAKFGNIPDFRVWVEVSRRDEIPYFRFNAFMNPVQLMGAYNQFIQDNMEAPGSLSTFEATAVGWERSGWA